MGGECTGNLQLNSTLVDGVYPRGTIDTAQPDWAMDFFTVNRNGNNLIQIRLGTIHINFKPTRLLRASLCMYIV